MKNAGKAILLFGALTLSGCISGVKEPDSYTDRNGKTTLIETDRESCTRSCNEEYSRCMETEPAEQNSLDANGFHDKPGIFGASADCHNDLKNCLPTCNTQ